MQFTYQKLAMEILGFVNMNKTERISHAFNIAAPGGRYYSNTGDSDKNSRPKQAVDPSTKIFFRPHYITLTLEPINPLTTIIQSAALHTTTIS